MSTKNSGNMNNSIKSPSWIEKNTWKRLEEIDSGEEGEAPGSDVEDQFDGTIYDLDVENELIKIHPRFRFEYKNGMEQQPVSSYKLLEQSESVDGIMWNFDVENNTSDSVGPGHGNGTTHLKE